MTDLFNDDIFSIADGVEQVDLTSGGPWRAIVRRITRTEQAETSLSADTVVFMVEPSAVVNIGDTITRSDESTYTIIKAQLRSHDSRWVVYTVSGNPPDRRDQTIIESSDNHCKHRILSTLRPDEKSQNWLSKWSREPSDRVGVRQSCQRA